MQLDHFVHMNSSWHHHNCFLQRMAWCLVCFYFICCQLCSSGFLVYCYSLGRFTCSIFCKGWNSQQVHVKSTSQSAHKTCGFRGGIAVAKSVGEEYATCNLLLWEFLSAVKKLRPCVRNCITNLYHKILWVHTVNFKFVYHTFVINMRK